MHIYSHRYKDFPLRIRSETKNFLISLAQTLDSLRFPEILKLPLLPRGDFKTVCGDSFFSSPEGINFSNLSGNLDGTVPKRFSMWQWKFVALK